MWLGRAAFVATGFMDIKVTGKQVPTINTIGISAKQQTMS